MSKTKTLQGWIADDSFRTIAEPWILATPGKISWESVTRIIHLRWWITFMKWVGISSTRELTFFIGIWRKHTTNHVYFSQKQKFEDEDKIHKAENNRASVYQNEESEQWMGEWMEKRGNRDSLVIATKYTMNWRAARTQGQIQSNFLGNSVKTMHMSIGDSLKKLRTDYIDIVCLR